MTRALVLVSAFALLLPLTGCGKKLHPVTGSVTLDGKAVAGATVTFVSDDGKFTANAVTDDAGNFNLDSQAGSGAYAGTYKVTVAKYAKIEGTSPGTDGSVSKDYSKQMSKEADAGKTSSGPKMPPGAKMPPGMMMPGGGGAMGSGAKSELPEVYASLDKTPLKATVPADGGVKLELKSK